MDFAATDPQPLLVVNHKRCSLSINPAKKNLAEAIDGTAKGRQAAKRYWHRSFCEFDGCAGFTGPSIMASKARKMVPQLLLPVFGVRF
jgi:hypothetical protein